MACLLTDDFQPYKFRAVDTLIMLPKSNNADSSGRAVCDVRLRALTC